MLAPCVSNVTELKSALGELDLGDEKFGWIFRPEQLLSEFEGHLASVADYFERLPATGTPDQVADVLRWGKKVTDILRLIRLIRSARAEGEHEIAQALFYLLGSGLTSAGFAKATIGEQPTDVDEISSILEKTTAALAETEALWIAADRQIRGRTIPATNAKVALAKRVQEHIEQLDRDLGKRTKRTENKDERVTSVRNHIIANQPEWMKKIPSKRVIENYVK